VDSPGHVAVTDETARDEFWPRYLEVIRSVSKTRGFAIPTKESFLYEVGPQGALSSDRQKPSPRRSRRISPRSTRPAST
jgi:hypothetical protein